MPAEQKNEFFRQAGASKNLLIKPNKTMSKILAIFRVPDMSQGQYDNVIKDLEAAGAGKVNARTYHVMGLNENGSVVADTWDSQEDLNKFFETLGPILVKNGVNPQPPEIFPVHNVIL